MILIYKDSSDGESGSILGEVRHFRYMDPPSAFCRRSAVNRRKRTRTILSPIRTSQQ